MNIGVFGAGVSGLTIAKILKNKGYDVTILEKDSTIGGLARTRFTGGKLYDPYGGHIFNSKKKEVVDWVFSMLPKDNWKYTERNAKIFFDGKYISYPFELSLCELNEDDAVNCVFDYMMSQTGEEPDNFRDWLVWNFGESIANYYMIPYNEKIWAYPLDEMETKWMQGKMPLPSKKEILKSLVLKDPKERKMPHSTFYYPLEGGIQTMVNAIGVGINIQLNSPVKSIEKKDDKWIVNNMFQFDRVISTIPLPVLGKIMDIPSTVKNSIKGLKYNSLNTILFDCPKTDITWLYIPSHKYKSHRVGYQSTLTPNYGNNKDKGLAALEIIGSQINVDSNFAMQKNILPDELGFDKVLDYDYTEYAYVIYDINYRKNLNNVMSYFDQDSSFQLLGRWGRWNYNNMDMCMWDAMQLSKEY